MVEFDYRESTITFDYESKTVEFYFTKESNYTSLIKRNPNFLSCKDLQPGYMVVYPMDECRVPESLAKVRK